MAMKKITSILAVIILVSGITGCAIGNKGTVTYNRTTSVGQELIDLKEAKEKGAITDDEYHKAKKHLLEEIDTIKVECSSED